MVKNKEYGYIVDFPLGAALAVLFAILATALDIWYILGLWSIFLIIALVIMFFHRFTVFVGEVVINV